MMKTKTVNNYSTVYCNQFSLLFQHETVDHIQKLWKEFILRLQWVSCVADAGKTEDKNGQKNVIKGPERAGAGSAA